MSETTPELQPFPCDGCGQTDTDPMIHVAYGSWQKDDRTTIAEPSFHYDCLPKDMIPVWFGDDFDAPQHAVTKAAIEAAESGIHGEELREFIQSQPDDNNVEPDAGAPAETQEA